MQWDDFCRGCEGWLAVCSWCASGAGTPATDAACSATNAAVRHAASDTGAGSVLRCPELNQATPTNPWLWPWAWHGTGDVRRRWGSRGTPGTRLWLTARAGSLCVCSPSTASTWEPRACCRHETRPAMRQSVRSAQQYQTVQVTWTVTGRVGVNLQKRPPRTLRPYVVTVAVAPDAVCLSH